MKIRTIVLGFLLGAIAFAVCFEYSWAESKTDKNPLKIGVVSIRKIFQDSKRTAKHDREAAAEERRVIAELEKLNAEVEAERAKLGTLKTGSSDYLASFRERLNKEAEYQALKKYYEEQIMLKDRQWTGELYEEILQITNEVAEQKDLDLVFEESKPKFPLVNSIELAMAMRTHKLLYCRGCLDITDEVMARLDKEK